MSRFVLTAQLQLQAPTNVGQVVRQIQNQLNGVSVNVAVTGTQQATRQINQVAAATNQASNAATALGKSFGLSIKRFAAFSIATRAVSLFTSTLSKAIKESIAFERELLKISQVTGKTISQLGDLTGEITRLSTSLGVSSSSLLGVSRILSQAGLNADETRIALDALAKSELAPTFDDITQTAEGAVAIFNQFRSGAEALEAQLGAINAVAGRFAVEAGDLISVVRRTGGVFKAAGGELNELIALFTSVRATTRESAESIATGLRTIFTRIQRPQTIEYLKQFGVELLDLEGKFVGPFEAVRRLSQALIGLEEGDITFVQIAEELGGFRQIGKVIPLLQQFSVAQEALNVAQKGSGSLADDAAKAQLALAVKITKVKEEFLALVRSITTTTSFQVFANTALNLASALIKLADALKPIIPLLTTFAGIKLATGLGSFVKGIGGGLRTPRGFATGGLVPGSGNRDTVPAMLTPGEFVIRKSSVAKLGAGNLAAMNENRYAGGTPLKGVPKPKPKSVVQKGKQVGGVGIFDSDKIPGGTNVKKALLEQLRASKKPYQVISGPAGSGKTTFAAGRFGANFVLTPADLQKYSRFVVLSGAGKTKSGDFSDDVKGLLSGASGITVLNPGVDRLMQQRQGRVDAAMSGNLPDQRSAGALQGTMRAPTDSNLDLFRGYGNVNVLDRYAAGGVVTGNRHMYGSLPPTNPGLRQSLSDITKSKAPTLGKSYKAQGDIGALKLIGEIDQLSDEAITTLNRDLGDYAGAFLRPEGRGQVVQGTLDKSSVAKGVQENPFFKSLQAAAAKVPSTGLVNQVGVLLKKEIDQIAKGSQGKQAGFLLHGGSLTTQESERMEDTILNGIVQTVNNAGQQIGGQLTTNIPDLTKTLKNINIDQIVGNIFEGVLLSAGAPYNPNDTDANEDFDFPGGLGAALAQRYGLQSYAGVQTDAKSSFTSDNLKTFVKKVKNVETKKSVSEINTRLNPEFAKIRALLAQVQAAGPQPEAIKQLVGGKGTLTPAQLASLGNIKFATGGAVGTDTVPALLTPGEFVINRSSAQKIGYGSLNRMNKVGKYAKGGVVHKFARGTSGTGVPARSGGSPVSFDFDASPVVRGIQQAARDLGILKTAAQKVSLGLQEIATVSPALAAAYSNSGVFANLSAQQQKLVVDEQKKEIALLQKSGKSQEEVKAKLDEYSTTLKKQSAQAAKSALNDAGFQKGGRKDKLMRGDQSVVESRTKSLYGKEYERQLQLRAAPLKDAATGAPLRDAKNKIRYESTKQTEARIAASPGGTAAITSLKNKSFDTAKSQVGQEQQKLRAEAIKLAQSFNQASTSANQSAASSKNAAMGDNMDAQASKNAAQADQLEASASKAASGKGSSGGGGMMGGGGGKGGKGGGDVGAAGMSAAMGLTMAAASIQAFLPPLDESSGMLMQLTHGGLQAITMMGSLVMVMQSLAPGFTMASAGSFLLGKSGTSAAIGTFAAGKAMWKAAASATGASGALQRLAGSAMMGSANLVGALVGAVGPLIAVVGGFMLLNMAFQTIANSMGDYENRLKKATDAGDKEGAGNIAVEQGQAMNTATAAAAALTIALIALAVGVGILTLPFALLLAGVVALIAAFTIASANTDEYNKANAQAKVQVIKAEKALEKSAKDSAEAMKKFEEGTISAEQAMRAGADAAREVAQSRLDTQAANKANNAQKSTGDSAVLRDIFTLGGLIGESSSERNSRIDSENAQRTEKQKKLEADLFQQQQPAINAYAKSVAASSGDLEQFKAKLREIYGDQFVANNEQALTDSFNNIAKEVERAQKAFNAMNLGMRSVAATAGALSVSMDNYLASQEAGYIGLDNTIRTLEASITSAAAGMDKAEIDAALNDAGNNLRELGANEASIDKFKQNMDAISQAQAGFANASQATKDKLVEDLKRGAGGPGGVGPTREGLAEALTANLAGVDEATKQRISDAIAGADISPDDLNAIMGGNMDVLDRVLTDLGEQTLEQVMGPLKEMAKYQQQLVDLTKKRIDMEDRVVAAQQNLIKANMEAAEIIAKYGGPAVTPEMQRQSIIAQANVQGQQAGISPMMTGSAAEINARSRQIREGLAQTGRAREAAAAGDKTALEGRKGVELAAQEKRLQDLAKAEYETTKQLIGLKEEELKLIQEKNRLEKSSIEALLTGDIDKFFEQQAAVGATASIALGNQSLMGAFGPQALGQAALDIQKQQEAGVQTLYGQQLSGPGGLTERGFGAALASRGVSGPNSLSMAQVAAGTTAEEESAKAEIRALAATLPNFAQTQLQVAEQDLQVANMQMEAAEKQLEAAKARVAANEAGANAPGGVGQTAQTYPNLPPTQNNARGGLIYANRGIFVPRGTDTVPAMLTPGEFVVRRSAVQRGNNLAILQAMNRGQSGVSNNGAAVGMANGGRVKYFRFGGMSDESGGGGGSVGVGITPELINKLSTSLNTFNSELSANIEKLNSTTFNVKLDSTAINVNLSGGSFLQKLNDDLREELLATIADKLGNASVDSQGRVTENTSGLPKQ